MYSTLLPLQLRGGSQERFDFLFKDIFAYDPVMRVVGCVIGVAVVDGFVRGIGLEDGVKFRLLGFVISEVEV